MMHISKIILALSCIALPAISMAQSQHDTQNIVDVINRDNGSVTIVQSPTLDIISSHSSMKPAVNGMGFRIQVFSDNDMRSAKSNAEYRKRAIQQEMPELNAYVTFESPYWKVRVGDFRSYSQANAALRQLQSDFPAFANDMRIVRERINTAQ